MIDILLQCLSLLKLCVPECYCPLFPLKNVVMCFSYELAFICAFLCESVSESSGQFCEDEVFPLNMFQSVCECCRVCMSVSECARVAFTLGVEVWGEGALSLR